MRLSLDKPELYIFRRMQLNQQQALKQQKNCLQQCLVFDCRARQMQAEFVDSNGVFARLTTLT